MNHKTYELETRAQIMLELARAHPDRAWVDIAREADRILRSRTTT